MVIIIDCRSLVKMKEKTDKIKDNNFSYNNYFRNQFKMNGKLRNENIY